MKLIQKICKAAALALTINAASAAPFAFNDGDIILGVQAYGGTGASQNVFFNVGSATELRDNGNKGQVGNIGATLTKVFGANWYSRTDVYFGAIGNLTNAPPTGIFKSPAVNGDPARTIYVSQPSDSPGSAQLIPEGSYVNSSLGSAATKFTGVETMIIGQFDTPPLEQESDKSAILDQTTRPVEWNNSWSTWNPSLGLGIGPAFDTFNGGIQQNFGKTGSAVYVDIQRVLASNEDANPAGVVGGGTYETTIAITSTGAIIVQTTPIVSAPTIDIQQPAGTSLTDGATTSNFGKVQVKQTSAAKVYTITNSGNASLTGLALTKDGTHANDYQVTSLTVTTLAPGASTTISVTFKPTAAGTRTAAIHIASNDEDKNPFDIKLTGSAVAANPKIEIFQPTSKSLKDGKSNINFGKVKVGKTGLSKSFTIRNTGGANLTKLVVKKTGKQSKDFIVSKPKSKTLKPGASTTFTVKFKPKAKGTRKASLQIRSNDKTKSPFDIGLKGKGVR